MLKACKGWEEVQDLGKLKNHNPVLAKGDTEMQGHPDTMSVTQVIGESFTRSLGTYL